MEKCLRCKSKRIKGRLDGSVTCVNCGQRWSKEKGLIKSFDKRIFHKKQKQHKEVKNEEKRITKSVCERECKEEKKRAYSQRNYRQDSGRNGSKLKQKNKGGKMKKKRLVKYSDSGHGWLAVKIADLAKLGIKNQITGHSYKYGKTAYLEEDCDALLYLQKLEKNGIEYDIVRKSPWRYL